jgi:hypothetical protein
MYRKRFVNHGGTVTVKRFLLRSSKDMAIGQDVPERAMAPDRKISLMRGERGVVQKKKRPGNISKPGP